MNFMSLDVTQLSYALMSYHLQYEYHLRTTVELEAWLPLFHAGKSKVVCVNAMKTCGRVELQLREFLTSSTLRSMSFKEHVVRKETGWVPEPVWTWWQKIPCSCWTSNQPVLSHCSGWAIPTESGDLYDVTSFVKNCRVIVFVESKIKWRPREILTFVLWQ